MAKHETTNQCAAADQRLRQLIKLKQLEKPDEAFWQRFEQEYRSRQLTSFVQTQPLHTRLRKACMIVARKAAPPVAAAGAITLTFFTISGSSDVRNGNDTTPPATARLPASAIETEREEAYFLVDKAPENERVLNKQLSSDTTYQINVLNKSTDRHQDYQLNASPLSYRQSSSQQPFGAQIISAQGSY